MKLAIIHPYSFHKPMGTFPRINRSDNLKNDKKIFFYDSCFWVDFGRDYFESFVILKIELQP
jgi:hypothetical protein